MYFLYPHLLWALLALSIPVIIHFFNIRKYKRIYFSDTRWIKQITQESQVKNKLKEYLILISRLLAMLFLILSFAQPVSKNKVNINFKGTAEVVIYIDNSFSMENISKEGNLFENALNKAKEIIQSFSKSTKFYILTNVNDWITLKPLSQDEAIEHLSKIKITADAVPLSDIFHRIEALQLKSPLMFIISDAQKKFTDIQNIQKNSINAYYLLFSASQTNNISIDSVWIDNPVVLPGNPQTIHIKITNHNAENINDIPIKLMLNGIQTSIMNVSIPAHQSIETTTSFIPDKNVFQYGKVFINDYPVTFDDEMYFSVNSNMRIKVLLVNGMQNPPSSKYFKSFFQNDSVFIYSEQQEKQINFSELAQQDVVVLNEITEFSSGLEEQLNILCKKGKTIIIIPYLQNNTYSLPSELKSLSWQIDTSKQTLNNDLFSHPLLSGVFEKNNISNKMPSVKEFIFTNKNSSLEPIIQFNNNKPFLIKYTKNKWNYFVFTSGFHPEKNQMVMHALFVPLMYQLSFTSVPNIPLYYYSKQPQNIRIPNIMFDSDDSPKIISTDTKNNNFQIIPIFKTEEHVSYINIPIHYDIPPGHYHLQWKGQDVFALSFNYNRLESDMQFYTAQDLKNLVLQYNLKNIHIDEIGNQSLKKMIQSEITGKSYWKLCLILSLIFFVTESMIIRWMK